MRTMTVRAALVTGAVAIAALALAPTTDPAKPPTMASPFASDFNQQDLTMAAQGCGTERWAIKTASDSQAGQVSTTQHQTTIAALRALHKPSSLPSNSRIRPTEITEYVIADSAKRTMIVELADPRCVTGARFKTEITNVRKAFAARYTPTGTMQHPNRAIRVRGIGFFDHLHGQTGVAPNGIELHPVLGLGFP